MKHILLSLICLLPVSEIILSAQSARMFTVTSGLISSQVDGIFQDGENSIWITSGYGLTRYDGSNFEHFHHEEGNPFSLSSDNAHFILEDIRGTVWVGTEHGLDIYDPDNNSFSQVVIPFSDPDVTWLIEANVTEKGSKIYCSVLLQGMCVVDAVTHEPDTALTSALEGVLGTGRGPVMLDSSGLLWKEKPGEGLKAFDTQSSAEVTVSWNPDAEAFRDRFGISALVEAHNEDEIKTALNCGARLIGVNNRNLKDFSVSNENSRRLRALIPKDVIFVSESGVKNAEDIRALREIGVDAVLIGETMMRAADKTEKLKELKG